jgi:hypothetical protein
MEIITKMILPIVDSAISNEFIKSDCGFVNAYLEDINRPYLNNHIFLLYKNIPFCVDNILTHLKTFYNKYDICIKGIWYKEYAFIRNLENSQDVKNILNGIPNISASSESHILYFYHGDNICDYFHYHLPIPLKKDILPIEDYITIFNEKTDIAFDMV